MIFHSVAIRSFPSNIDNDKILQNNYNEYLKKINIAITNNRIINRTDPKTLPIIMEIEVFLLLVITGVGTIKYIHHQCNSQLQ